VDRRIKDCFEVVVPIATIFGRVALVDPSAHRREEDCDANPDRDLKIIGVRVVEAKNRFAHRLDRL
jgi:hypothetical protein